MSIFATAPEKKERELIPAGTRPAYLYRVIYLGTQKKEFTDKSTGAKRITQKQRVWLDFEFPEFIEEYEDKETKEKKKYAKSLGIEFSLTLAEMGSLRPFIEGWTGKKLSGEEAERFDICSLLGHPAFVSIIHAKGKNGDYANIASVSPVMENFPMPPMFNQPIEIGKAEWGTDYFDELPKFLQDKIMESNEWKMFTQPSQSIPEQLQPEKIVGGGQYRVAEVPEVPTIHLDV